MKKFVVIWHRLLGREKSYLSLSGNAFTPSLSHAKKFDTEDEADTALAKALSWANNYDKYTVEEMDFED